MYRVGRCHGLQATVLHQRLVAQEKGSYEARLGSIRKDDLMANIVCVELFIPQDVTISHLSRQVSISVDRVKP